MRTILAGIAGAILMFVWSTIAHVVLPLGEVGVSPLPHEGTTMPAIVSQMDGLSGLYIFPDLRPGKATADKTGTGPSGLLVYRANATLSVTPSELGKEFATELVESLIAALLLSWTALGTFVGRVGFVTLVGLAASIATNVPYWNWYGFPVNYTLANIVMVLVGYFAAGLALAWLVPRVNA